MHKIIYSLLTSWFSFLLLRSRRSYSGLRSFRLSALWRFIRTRMPALLFFFLLFLPLFLPVSPVEAQTPTDTPAPVTATATGHPLWPSMTPEPTQNYTCPGSQPIGWGTVTPDPYWLLNCQVCVTPQVQVTETPYPVSTYMIPLTQTAQAITTLTPATSTVTVTPAATSIAGTPTPGNPLLVCDSPGCVELSDTSIMQHFVGEVLVSTHPQVVVTMNYHRTSSAWASLYVYYWVTHAELQNTTTVGKNVADYYRTTSNVNLHNNQFPVTGISAGMTKDATFDYSVVTASTNWMGTIFTGIQLDGAIGVIYRYDMDIYVSTVPMDFGLLTVTHTPVFTATPYSNCGVVDPDPDTGGDGDFEIPDPWIGGTTCPIDFGGVDIPLYGIFGLADFHLPGLRVCFTEITFGTLVYYGVAVDVDYLAYILAAAALIGMFTKGQ